MRSRLTLAALALTLAIGACDRDAPTSANTVPENQTPPTAPPQQRTELIFPVDPVQTFGTVAVASVKITQFNYRHGVLLVSGQLRDASNNVIGSFKRVPATLTASGSPTQPTCQILNLDIGAIHLNLLGLVVDLAPIHLDITGVTGPGNLLGNLLCALVGILDPPGPLSQILDIIARINRLLG